MCKKLFYVGIKEKIAVACKDFTTVEKHIVEYAQFKLNTPEFNEYSSVNALSNDFIRQVEFLDKFSAEYFDIKKRFWRTFILDAFIGNGDRTDNNQAFLGSYKGLRLAPVYDCEAGLNPNWSLEKMSNFLNLKDRSKMVYKARTCCYSINNKPINPYKIIREHFNEDCVDALKWFLDIYDTINFAQLIECEASFLPQLQKDFYIELLRERAWFLRTIDLI